MAYGGWYSLTSQLLSGTARAVRCILRILKYTGKLALLRYGETAKVALTDNEIFSSNTEVKLTSAKARAKI